MADTEVQRQKKRILDLLKTEITELEERFEYLQDSNQPTLHCSQKLQEKRKELETIEKFTN